MADFVPRGQRRPPSSIFIVPGLPSAAGASLMKEAKCYFEHSGYQVSVLLLSQTHYAIPLTEQIMTLQTMLQTAQALERPAYLIGYSLGAIPALATGSLSCGVILWDPSAHPNRVFEAARYRNTSRNYGYKGLRLSIASKVIDDLANIPPMSSVVQQCLARTSIITAGGGGARQGKAYFTKLPNTGTYIDIRGSDHTFTGASHRRGLFAHTLTELRLSEIAQ